MIATATAFLKRILIPSLAVFFFALGLLVGSILVGSRSIIPSDGQGDSVSPSGQYQASSLSEADNGRSQAGNMEMLELLQQNYRAVVNKVEPTVVEIDELESANEALPRSPLESSFSPEDSASLDGNQEYLWEGLGSGVLVRQSGDTVYVLTNSHVAGGTKQFGVKLYDDRHYNATLVGEDPQKDLALLQFRSNENMPLADLGDSDTLSAGDLVFAVAISLGFESSLATGIVSGIGRYGADGSMDDDFADYIQADGAITQGNSGGALVDVHGQVIGINTWIAFPSGGDRGQGLAIPINDATKSMDELIAEGGVENSWLGVDIGDLPYQMAGSLALGDKKGTFVYGVFRGSPAERAGILPGDFIVALDGNNITSADSLLFEIAGLPSNKRVDLSIIRYGKPMELKVRIGARNAEENAALITEKIWPGFAAVNITSYIRKKLEINSDIGNVIVSSVKQQSPADIGGIRVGDIIVAVNGQETSSLQSFYEEMNSSTKDTIALDVRRGGIELQIGLRR